MERGAIGVFDSGIGGISVLQRLVAGRKGDNFVYLFDKSGLPYGNKSKSEITRRACNNARLLVDMRVKAVVVACNTASCVALDKIKETCFVPVVGVIPPVEIAVSEGRERVLVLATPLTLGSDVMARLKKQFGNKLIYAPQKDLASLIEYKFGSENALYDYAQAKLSKYLGKIDSVVLGCTHYYHARNFFERYFKVKVYDGLEGVEHGLDMALGKSCGRGFGGKTVFFYR